MKTKKKKKLFLGGKAEISLIVDLKGEKLKEYKEKYGKDGSNSDWMQKKPQLPSYWKAEKSACSTGETHMKWDWKFTGPQDTEMDAMEVIESFLEGFRWWYEDEEPPKEEDWFGLWEKDHERVKWHRRKYLDLYGNHK